MESIRAKPEMQSIAGGHDCLAAPFAEQLMPFVTIDDIKIDITMMDSIGRNTIGINVSFHITRDPTTLDSVIVSI